MSRLSLVLDSSQITSFLECDRLWKYKYDEKLTSSNQVREDMAMGTYGHKLLEIYYTNIALGKTISESQKIAMDAPIDQEHEMVGIQCKHCGIFASGDFIGSEKICKRFPLSQENRQKVRTRFQDYWMTYSKNDITPLMGNPEHKIVVENGIPKDVYVPKPLVEQGFSYELLNNESYLFVLEGRVDLMGTLSGYTGFMDHKFQSRERSLYDRSIQFRNYSLATGLSFGIVNYIRLHKEVKATTLERQLIWFTPQEREAWKLELIGIFKRIAHDMQSGEFPKRRNSCEGKFGYPCEFTKVCDEPLVQVGEAIKQMHFVKREEWKPW